MNTFELLTATKEANSLEESGFLFLAAQMRFEIGKQVYPPVQKGGDSPDVLQSALSFSIGQSISPSLASDPVTMAKVTKRLAKWAPSFGSGYFPGWEYQNALDEKSVARIAAAIQKSVVGPLGSQAKLMENQEYLRLSHDLSDADAVKMTLEAQMQNAGSTSRPEQLQTKHEEAATKKIAVATRMKELEWELNPESRWHAQVGWKAEDYFHDPLVIELCHAIEANDIKEMERLIASGADVNATGTNGMTLLLWAFPDRKIERFECLLRHGANPNVFFESDFGIAQRSFHPIPGGHLFFPTVAVTLVKR